jgi:virulence-associated protein VapD
MKEAELLIEHALLLKNDFMDQDDGRLLSCLYANISCFHERKNDLKAASFYAEQAISAIQDKLNQHDLIRSPGSLYGNESMISEAIMTKALNMNNLCVIRLRENMVK